MIRHAKKLPGFDCFHGNCPAKNCTKTGAHGWESESWTFAVINDDAALRLEVRTPYAPSTVDKWRTEGAKFRAGFFSLHLGWRFNETPELLAAKATPNECDLLPGGKCWDGGTYGMKAEWFWAEYGSESFDQSERFWGAMEDELRSLSAEPRRFRHLKRCPYCAGDGFGFFAFPPSGGAR